MRGVSLASREWTMREKLVMIKSHFQFCYEVLCYSWICRHFHFVELTQRHCHAS
jgi:hypothetical protein